MTGSFPRHRFKKHRNSSAKKSTRPSDEPTAVGYECYIQENQRLGNEANSAYESSYKPFNWQKKCYSDGVDDISYGNTLKGTNSCIKSLRQLACEKVAHMIINYPEDLTDNILQKTPLTWDGGWKNVWDIVADSGKDSYKMFQRFANAFGQEKKFRCHGKQTYINAFKQKQSSTYTSLNSVHSRVDCMNSRLVTSKSNHRIEIIPMLENVGSLVTELNLHQNFKFLTFLDLSTSDGTKTWHRQVFLDIMALPSLVALDVSGCKNIDTGILKLWIVAIKSGQWTKLRLLDLSGCINITSSLTIIDLMEVSTDHATGKSGLVYLRISTSSFSADFNKQSYYLASFWSSRKELIDKSNEIGLKFSKNDFSANYGLAKKIIFLRNWFNKTSSNGNPLIVDPEVGASYVKKRYLLQEFVLNSGFKPEAKEKSIIEYFRISWPPRFKRSSTENDSTSSSNLNRRPKIRKSSRSIESTLGFY